MKDRRKMMGWIAAAAVLCSCASTGNLQNSLENQTSELNYLYDSRKTDTVYNVKVVPPRILMADTLPVTTKVKRAYFIVLPLLVFNYWKHNFHVDLGEGSIKNNFKYFLSKSFVEEAKRSGHFQVAGDFGDDVYRIDITVKRVESKSDYGKGGWLYFALYLYGYWVGETAGPVQSTLDVNVKIFKGSEQRFEENFTSVSSSGILSPVQGESLEQNLINSMVESLSFCVKEVNEKIIRFVNEKLYAVNP